MTLDLFARARTLLRRRASLPAAMALAALVSACSGESPTAVFDPDAPARLALEASVRFQTTTGAALRVLASYQRSNQTLVRIDSQSIALTEAASQQVPITIDLGACLRDPQRASLGNEGPTADECLVTLELALITAGQVVDRDTLRNISMRPGVTASAGAPITLEEVGSVRLTPPSANVVAAGQPLRLEATRTMTVAAEVIDGANRPITRTVTWSTANASVATVSASGVVTGVGAGTTRITAATGGSSAFVEVRVVPLPQTVTITAGTGSSGIGVVTSSPAGIDCTISGTTTSGTCSASFPGDATVSLSQRIVSTAAFVGWGGDCSGTTCSVVSSQPRTVSATFQAIRQLAVTGSGTGNGTIVGTPAPINCAWRNGSTSGQCLAQYPEGTSITLTATAEAGSQFVGWNGECTTVNGANCTFTMNANKAPVATFRALTTYRITAGLGNGTGTVTSSPSGMVCTVAGAAVSGTCSLTVPAGTNVSFVATGNSGSSWRTWDGLCANATATCALTASQLPGTVDLRVGFDQLVSLQVNVAPTSTGTGQLNGTGFFFCSINGTTPSVPCQQSYTAGTVVTVTASRTGYTDFVTWGGACASAGGNNDCTLTLTSNQVATVRFEEVPSALLTVEGNHYGIDYAVRVLHPYQSEQRCEVRELPSEEPTVCNLRVPLLRDFTLITAAPSNSLVYHQGLCENVGSPNFPCLLQLSGESFIGVYVIDPMSAIKHPTLVRTKREAPAPTSRR